MSLVFYISGHGFGHAARSALVVNALARFEPALPIILRTTVPEWFLRANLLTPAEIVSGETDTGVVQPDSLSIDEEETARRAHAFYRDFERHVQREAAFLHARGATLVVGDIPPLAFAAAARAGVPSVAIGNFTWDWIYGGFPGFDRFAPDVRRRIRDANAQATLTLRLPFAGGFEGMSHVEGVPLVARAAALSPDETRARLGLTNDRPIVLATFGGHGGNVPLDAAASDGTFRVVATDYEAPDGTSHPNLQVISAESMRRVDVTYTDLLAACDVVATKLGYGIVSECLANGVALLYTLRGRFIEQDVFMREMPAVMRSRMIGREDLIAGRWREGIAALLTMPRPERPARVDGADVAAQRILSIL